MPLPRRHFLLSGLAVGGLAFAGCTPSLRELRLQNLPQALEEMRHLGQASTLASRTVWSWSKTLEHLAQSIEYSMQGYPQAKSALFQRTLGLSAWKVFAWRGQMHHDLTEPIPGSPALDAHPPLADATLRLLHACQQFAQWQGPLQPHFAYGPLSHAEYEQAHAMHMANHFAAFSA